MHGAINLINYDTAAYQSIACMHGINISNLDYHAFYSISTYSYYQLAYTYLAMNYYIATLRFDGIIDYIALQLFKYYAKCTIMLPHL